MTYFKRSLTVLLTLVLLVTFCQTFAFADTATKISTVDQLIAITDGNYILTNDIDLADKPYTAAVIQTFNGTLDGNGYTIKGLNVTSDRAALFGTVSSGATVKNLAVKGTATATGKSAYAGGIAAINDGTIDNCASFVTITAVGTSSMCVGGITGRGNKGTVSASFNHGNITISDSSSGTVYVGGITGAYGKTVNCVNNGTLSVNTPSSAMTYAGGIGAYDTEIKLSQNNGTITATSSLQTYAGGIVAFLDTSSYTFVQTSTNTAAVTSSVAVTSADVDEDNIFAVSGGIAGYLAGAFDFPDIDSFVEASCTSVVRNCLNTAAVSASATGSDKARSYAGGIAGTVNGLVIYCVNLSKSISATTHGPIFAAVNPSGILRGKIRDCYTANSSSNTIIGNTDTIAAYAVLDDAALKNQTAYKSLNFETTWSFENNTPSLTAPAHTHIGTGNCSLCLKNLEPTTPPPPSSTFRFTDVNDAKWYAEYAYYAAEHGLITGTSETTFEPDTKLNRATFVTILAKVEGKYDTLDKSTKTNFTDVATGKWFSGAVAWAVEAGVTSGTSATTFEPMADITREQMCTMLVRYADNKQITINTTVNAKETFKDDNKISKWAKDSVYACQMSGIVNGLGDGNFGPKDTATRAQAAKIFSEFHKSYLAK